jgi:hypothetical protein
MMADQDRVSASRVRPPVFVLGLTVMLLGVVLLLGELDLIGLRVEWWRWWPVLMIGIGVSHLVTGRGLRSRRRAARFERAWPSGSEPRDDHGRCSPVEDSRGGGAWLVFIGTWLLLNNLGVLDFRTSWPVVIVGVGIMIIWGALTRMPASRVK